MSPSPTHQVPGSPFLPAFWQLVSRHITWGTLGIGVRTEITHFPGLMPMPVGKPPSNWFCVSGSTQPAHLCWLLAWWSRCGRRPHYSEMRPSPRSPRRLNTPTVQPADKSCHLVTVTCGDGPPALGHWASASLSLNWRSLLSARHNLLPAFPCFFNF